MVGRIAWRDLRFSFQRRNYVVIDRMRVAEGLDTETHKGFVRVAADSENAFEIIDIQDVFNFLTQKKLRHTANFFWNLSFDVEALFKYEKKILLQLAESNNAEYEKFKIRYLKGKCLTISDKNKNVYKFYDLAQFFHCSLAKACELYLREKVHELKSERANLFKDYSIDVIKEYCKCDASQTKRLADFFLTQLEKLQMNVKHFYSAGFLAQEYVLRNADIPAIQHTPNRINRLYWEAYRGGWFDTYKKGLMKLSAYDINSAYPAALRELPDLRAGVWHWGLDENAELGVMKVKLSSELEECQAIAFQVHGRNVYPLLNDDFETVITNSEYRVLKEFYNIKILEAHHFHEDRNCNYPFRNIIDILYSCKNNVDKTSMQYLLYKTILNSIYGKCAELVKKKDFWTWGKMFNPVYAAETTARTRMKIFQSVVNQREHIVSILTDAVLTDKPLNLKIGEKIGEWTEKERMKNCLVVQTGVYQFEGERPATRGFSTKNDLFTVCNSNNSKIVTNTLRPLHYKECIKQNDFERIATFVEVRKEIDLNNDIKRLWLTKIKSAKQLLTNVFDSLPVPVCLLPPYSVN